MKQITKVRGGEERKKPFNPILKKQPLTYKTLSELATQYTCVKDFFIALLLTKNLEQSPIYQEPIIHPLDIIKSESEIQNKLSSLQSQAEEPNIKKAKRRELITQAAELIKELQKKHPEIIIRKSVKTILEMLGIDKKHSKYIEFSKSIIPAWEFLYEMKLASTPLDESSTHPNLKLHPSLGWDISVGHKEYPYLNFISKSKEFWNTEVGCEEVAKLVGILACSCYIEILRGIYSIHVYLPLMERSFFLLGPYSELIKKIHGRRPGLYINRNTTPLKKFIDSLSNKKTNLCLESKLIGETEKRLKSKMDETTDFWSLESELGSKALCTLLLRLCELSDDKEREVIKYKRILKLKDKTKKEITENKKLRRAALQGIIDTSFRLFNIDQSGKTPKASLFFSVPVHSKDLLEEMLRKENIRFRTIPPTPYRLNFIISHGQLKKLFEIIQPQSPDLIIKAAIALAGEKPPKDLFEAVRKINEIRNSYPQKHEWILKWVDRVLEQEIKLPLSSHSVETEEATLHTSQINYSDYKSKVLEVLSGRTFSSLPPQLQELFEIKNKGRGKNKVTIYRVKEIGDNEIKNILPMVENFLSTHNSA